MNTDGTIKLYIDMPSWSSDLVMVDDFVVAVGKTKSNSVYHIAEVKPVPRPEKRITRLYLKVFRSDLLTAIRREPSQKVITIQWYSRNKK